MIISLMCMLNNIGDKGCPYRTPSFKLLIEVSFLYYHVIL